MTEFSNPNLYRKGAKVTFVANVARAGLDDNGEIEVLTNEGVKWMPWRSVVKVDPLPAQVGDRIKRKSDGDTYKIIAIVDGAWAVLVGGEPCFIQKRAQDNYEVLP